MRISKSKFRQIIKEELNEFNAAVDPRRAIQVEPTVPYAGKGKDIDVFGYQTRNFSFAPLASEFFENLIDTEDEAAKETLAAAAELLDNVLEIEKRAVGAQTSTIKDVMNSVTAATQFSNLIGKVSEKLGQELDPAFVRKHLEEIISRSV